jgi:uncharacterized membrane protein YoaK (UPF0700 family)
MVGTVSVDVEGRIARVATPSADSSLVTRLLPPVLGMTAGSVDAIGFLGLGLFTAHITGNLVVAAAHVVNGRSAPLAPMLAVPVFMVALGLTRLLSGALESIGFSLLRSLLLLQFVLLAGFLIVGVAAGPRLDPNAASAVLAGMLGVSAMAVQNAMAQISLRGAPSTTAMTGNVTRFTMDVGEALIGREPDDVARARSRAQHTWPTIVGFAAGCGLGAACEAAMGLWSLALPAGLALLAVAMGFVSVSR